MLAGTVLPGGFCGRPVCLTDAFASNRAFLNALMPDSRSAVTAVNKAIRGQQSIQPSETTKTRRLYSSAALAVDRGVLYLYGVDIAARALARLSSGSPIARRDGSSIARRISKACEVYDPPRRGVLRNRSAIGWFYLLGILEPVLRGFRPLSEVDIRELPSRPTQQSSSAWLESLVTDDLAIEIADMLRAVRDCRIPGTFRPNPTFGGIGAVTGSDGDWLAGDTLVELKCTISGVRREYVAQMLCYYAFDQLRAHGQERPYELLAAGALPTAPALHRRRLSQRVVDRIRRTSTCRTPCLCSALVHIHVTACT